jgi:hypothetical protein
VLRDGIASFVRAEVVPPERNDDVLTGPQRLYAKDGHYVPEVVALMREVRLASAKDRPENLRSADTSYDPHRPTQEVRQSRATGTGGPFVAMGLGSITHVG